MGERSLVWFTLLVQAACGALVGLVGVQLLGPSDVLGVVSFAVVGLLLLVAVVMSTLHLGAPRHAANALRNWRSSWLSREVLGLGLVGGLVALGAAVALLGEPEATMTARTLIAALAAAGGAFLVLSMVRLYAVRTIPEWDTLTTSARFAGSTLRLGAVVAAMLVTPTTRADDLPGAAVAWLVVLLALGLGLEAIVHERAGSATGAQPGALLVRGEGHEPDHTPTGWLIVGALVAGAGLVALAFGISVLAAILLVAGTLVLGVGELRQRERFYQLAPRAGREAMRPAAAPSRVSARR